MAKTTREAANRARTGEGPTFIDAQTYRYKGHSISDPAKYRRKEELESAISNDPIVVYQNVLKERGWIDQEAIDRMHESVKEEVEESIEFAEQSEPPASGSPLRRHHGRPLTSRRSDHGGAFVSRSLEPGDDRGDGARRERLPDGRGGRRVRRRLQGQPGDAQAVRRAAGRRHADLRGRVRRHRHRRGHGRACGRSSSS